MGKGISWSLSDEGILSINGNAALPEYNHPWDRYKDEIRDLCIGEGITEIGYGIFNISSLTNLSHVSIPSTMESINSSAFSGCNSLTSISYSGSAVQWASLSLGVYVLSTAQVEYVHKVIFDANGGKVGLRDKVIITGNTYGELPVPESRSGYNFNGWYTEKVGGTLVTASTSVTNEETHKLYAHWTAKSVDVTFDSNGGSVINTGRNLNYGSAYGELPVPAERAGLIFRGWYTEAEGGRRVSAETIVSNENDHILYAHWGGKKYKLSFDPNGGKCGEESRIVSYGSVYGELPLTNRLNYSFDGWYTQRTGGSRVINTTSIISPADHTLYAHWTLSDVTIIFDANGGECEVEEMVLPTGSVYGELPVPETRPGYSFLGWFTDRTGGTAVTTSTAINNIESYSLYAHWSVKNVTVTFDADGGSCSPGSKTFSYGEAYGILPTAVRNGYTFLGWYTSKTGGEQITRNKVITNAEDHTLYAHWSAEEAVNVTVTFNANGGTTSVQTKTVTFGSAFGELPTAARDGYVFLGWYTALNDGYSVDAASIVGNTSDFVLYALWKQEEAVKVTVSFDANGGTATMNSKTYTYGKKYEELPGANRNGYSFLGWYTSKTDGEQVTTNTVVTNTEAHTLYAHWSAEEAVNVTVTFNANGGTTSVQTKTVTFGSAFGELPTAVRSGYNFLGWYTALNDGYSVDATSIVANTTDFTLYAHWSKKDSNEENNDPSNPDETTEPSDPGKPDVSDEVVKLKGITLDKTTAEMKEGDTIALTVKFDPENATNKKIAWSSSDKEVATVDNGNVTAVKAGTATIEAISIEGGYRAQCTVTVSEKESPLGPSEPDLSQYTASENVIAVKSINLKKSLFYGLKGAKKFYLIDGDYSAVTIKGSTLTVLHDGTVTIQAVGKDGTKLAEATVSVITPVVNPDAEYMIFRRGYLDMNGYINSTVQPSSWKSSNKKVAEVNREGILTLKKSGTVKITATFPSKAGMTAKKLTVKLTVRMPQFRKSTYTVKVGRTVNTSVKNVYLNDITNFRIENESLAEVDVYGNVTGLYKGTTKLYMTVNGIEYEANIKVK